MSGSDAELELMLRSVLEFTCMPSIYGALLTLQSLEKRAKQVLYWAFSILPSSPKQTQLALAWQILVCC